VNRRFKAIPCLKSASFFLSFCFVKAPFYTVFVFFIATLLSVPSDNSDDFSDSIFPKTFLENSS